MIIIKTKNGDHFINEKSVTEVAHDRKNATAYYSFNGNVYTIKDVELVQYTNDTEAIKWCDEGSEVRRLNKEIGILELEKKVLIFNKNTHLRNFYALLRFLESVSLDNEEQKRMQGVVDSISVRELETIARTKEIKAQRDKLKKLLKKE